MFRFLLLFACFLVIVTVAGAQVAGDSIPISQADTNNPVQAQATDTIRRVNTIPEKKAPIIHRVTEPSTKDSFSMRPVMKENWEFRPGIPLSFQVLQRHPYFPLAAQPEPDHQDIRVFQGKETIFYVLTAILFLFALLKQSFGKYFADLFRVFFRTTMKQRQIGEQLMQSSLPSLCFNIFFVASTGLYIDFMLHYFELTKGLGPAADFWLMYLYCCIGLIVIYLGKFIGLKLVGWLFNMRKAADSYIFIVFIINKVMGIFLMPFLILLAFANEPLYSISLVISWCGIGALLFYRFILGFAAIRNEVKLNLFHFFLYLCAFEITPLLLIYRLLLLVF